MSIFPTILIALLCIAGIILSCLSISGTWLVVVATAIAAFLRPNAFPNLWLVVIFIVLSALVEVAETLSGIVGAQMHGGSKLSALAALIGGLAGMLLGTTIPIPILGNMFGLVIGSFALVFIVEYIRLKKANRAAHIALGTIISRVFVMMLKVTVTLAMIGILVSGIILNL